MNFSSRGRPGRRRSWTRPNSRSIAPAVVPSSSRGGARGAGTLGAGRLLTDASPAFASGGLTKGDAAILRFLAAAEILETDMWQQYNELAGIQDGEVPGGSGNPAYHDAVAVLDEDMDQYIHDNTDDEISHAAFINAY